LKAADVFEDQISRIFHIQVLEMNQKYPGKSTGNVLKGILGSILGNVQEMSGSVRIIANPKTIFKLDNLDTKSSKLVPPLPTNIVELSPNRPVANKMSSFSMIA
jgi:hypothetical protein